MLNIFVLYIFWTDFIVQPVFLDSKLKNPSSQNSSPILSLSFLPYPSSAFTNIKIAAQHGRRNGGMLFNSYRFTSRGLLNSVCAEFCFARLMKSIWQTQGWSGGRGELPYIPPPPLFSPLYVLPLLNLNSLPSFFFLSLSQVSSLFSGLRGSTYVPLLICLHLQITHSLNSPENQVIFATSTWWCRP